VSVPQHHAIADLVDGYRWTLAHFAECAVLVGDGLYRHTLCALRGLDPMAAVQAAQEEGDELLRQFEREYGRPIGRLVRTTALLRTGAFRDAHAAIVRLYDENTSFAAAVARDAQAFSHRQALHGHLAVPESTATAFAIKCLQEEVAVYLALARDGWLLDVYLGQELPTLARIIKHRIDGAPDELVRRINISLRTRHDGGG
jgi:tRNA-dependent cyclodipeptide synthase